MESPRKLVWLPQQDRNIKRSFRQYVQSRQLQGYDYCSDKQYYPYNLDVDDSGWGCAWRCIQMMLTQHDLQFAYLFTLFGSKPTLLDIFERLHPENKAAMEALHNKPWAPHELSNGWGQPFVAHLVLASFDIKSELLLLNAYPHSANAPPEVFEDTLSFQLFRDKLINHFGTRKGLVMLDDATYALVIFGCRVDSSNNLRLLIGDPHVATNKACPFAGIYEIVVDTKGKQISASLSEQQRKCMLYPSYSALQFTVKPWMILFAHS